MRSQAKIILSVFALFFILIITMTLMSYHNFSASSETMKRHELDVMARSVGKAVAIKMQDYFTALELTSELLTNTEHLKESDIYAFRQKSLKVLKENTNTLEAYYAFKNGETHTSTRTIPNFTEIAKKREWYVRLHGGEKRIVTTPYVSSVGFTVMAAGVPLIQNGTVFGTLCINLKLTEITNFTNNVLDFENIILTRSDGYIMAHKNEAFLGKSLWDMIPALQDYKEATGAQRINFDFEDEAYEGSLYTLEDLGWKIWVFEKESVIQADSNANLKASLIQLVIALFVSALAIGTLVSFLIFKPLAAMTRSMRALAEGHLETHVPALHKKDEIGEMAQSVQVFKDNALRVKQLEQDQEAQKKKAEETRKTAMLSLADRFEERVARVIEDLSTASTAMNTSSEKLSHKASATHDKAVSVAKACGEASSNVAMVAAATEELSSAVGEIGQQVQRSTNITERAVDAADGSNQRISNLSDIVNDIGDIVSLIDAVAEQTNLLALNATIEAARAGDAGKGFAVVAGEVKNLATQTGKATNDIATQIAKVQTETKNVVTTNGNISTVIIEMNEITAAIASSVEQQLATTSAIARNIELASLGAHDVSTNIQDVQNSAEETNVIAEHIATSAVCLSGQAQILEQEVSGFLQQVRSDAAQAS